MHSEKGSPPIADLGSVRSVDAITRLVRQLVPFLEKGRFPVDFLRIFDELRLFSGFDC